MFIGNMRAIYGLYNVAAKAVTMIAYITKNTGNKN